MRRQGEAKQVNLGGREREREWDGKNAHPFEIDEKLDNVFFKMARGEMCFLHHSRINCFTLCPLFTTHAACKMVINFLSLTLTLFLSLTHKAKEERSIILHSTWWNNARPVKWTRFAFSCSCDWWMRNLLNAPLLLIEWNTDHQSTDFQRLCQVALVSRKPETLMMSRDLKRSACLLPRWFETSSKSKAIISSSQTHTAFNTDSHL